MRRIILIIMVFVLLLPCVSCSPQSEPFVLPEITIPEQVDVDFRPFLMEDTGTSNNQQSERVFAFMDNKRCAFQERISYHLSEQAYVIQDVLFADAKVLADMFDLEYLLSKDKSSAQMKRGKLSIEIVAESNTITVNETEYSFITTVKIRDTLMLPVQDFAEGFGYIFQYDAESQISYIAANEAMITEDYRRLIQDNYTLYQNVVYNYDDVECDMTGVGVYKKTKPSERMVGLAYSTWTWEDKYIWGVTAWNKPILEDYHSLNRDVIYQHGVWLAEADVDFVFVDWSNNTDYDPETMSDKKTDFKTIETATDLLFEIWAEIPNAPRICIFVGPGHSGTASIRNGNHQKKVDQIYNDYIKNEKNKEMYFFYDGKPLLICYGATPTAYGANPTWSDNRFTVRWMTGYVGQQPNLFNPSTLQSERYWSWEERGAQTFTVHNGTVEAVTCSAATRQQGKPGDAGYIEASGRQNGLTLKRQFQRANELGARIVLLVSWNEWSKSEQPSIEISKDLEPCKTFGTFYYDLMREQIRKFKGKL